MLYLLAMLDIVLKYVFSFLICVPIFVFGTVLFIRLRRESRSIDEEIRIKKEAKKKSKQELLDFDIDYRSKHPGKID